MSPAGPDPTTQEDILHFKKNLTMGNQYQTAKKIKELCFVRDMNSLLYVSFFSCVGTALPYPISAVYLLFAAEEY